MLDMQDRRTAILTELQALTQSAHGLAFLSYAGLTEEQDAALRAAADRQGCAYRIFKKSFLLQLLPESRFAPLAPILEHLGSVACLFFGSREALSAVADSDPVIRAEHMVSAAMLDGQLLDCARI